MDALATQPYIVTWNLTERCNLSCRHCSLDGEKRANNPQSELSRDEARFVIDELSYLNKNLTLILSGGEPMLREDLGEIIQDAADAGFDTLLRSNGTLLTREGLRALKDAGLRRVAVSIDSPQQEHHDLSRGLEGAWDLSVAALHEAPRQGLETFMDVTLTDGNWTRLDEFVEFGASLGVRAVNFFFFLCTGSGVKMDITVEHFNRSLRRILSLARQQRQLRVRARCAPHIYRIQYEEGMPLPAGSRGCMAAHQHIRIDAEGNITPCPFMPLPVGNVRERSLGEIWESAPSLNLIRTGAYKGRCGVCEYRDLCGGCRARALAGQGDFMGEDLFCDYTPRGGKKVLPEKFGEKGSIWTDEAKARISVEPLSMQTVITRIIETRARECGISCITPDFIDRIKSENIKEAGGR